MRKTVILLLLSVFFFVMIPSTSIRASQPPFDPETHPSPYWLNINSRTFMLGASGFRTQLRYTIYNQGENDDTYTIAVSDYGKKWFVENSFSTVISVPSKQKRSFYATVQIPEDTESGIKTDVALVATSHGSPGLFDVARTEFTLVEGNPFLFQIYLSVFNLFVG